MTSRDPLDVADPGGRGVLATRLYLLAVVLLMALTSKIEKLNTQWNEARRVSHSREACDPDVVRFAFQIKAKVITGEGVPANKRIAVQMYLLEMWLRERGVKVPPQR